MNDWLRRQQRKKIPYSFFQTALENRKEGSVIAKKVNWVGCQGSEPHFRGFPCSLWVLFHFLTVQAARKNVDHSQEKGESGAVRPGPRSAHPVLPPPAPAAGPSVGNPELAAGHVQPAFSQKGGPGEATQSCTLPQGGAPQAGGHEPFPWLFQSHGLS